MDLTGLEQAVAKWRAALAEARLVHDQANIEKRELTAIRFAEDRLSLAEIALRVARQVKQKADREDAEAARLKEREPPSLEVLVKAHGTYDKIPEHAWRLFNVDMAEWKAKIGNGEFKPKIWW